MAHFTDTLNPAQREAVVNYDKPSLIVAGAGSGKTRVLTSRIAYMIERGVYPGSILALTFTNKAAREMRERIETIVPGGMARYIWMGTFHSIFYRILRREAEKLGFAANFTIYDTSSSESLLSSIVKERKLNTDEYKPRALLSRISLAKNNLVTADAYAANPSFMEEDRKSKRPEFAEIFREYSRRCRANNAMDFDDLLLYTNILFRDSPETLAEYQNRFRYILVDEYQDTNYAQYLIVRRLAQGHSNVCVVGDDAQSIYSFRGAKIENILRFQSDFPTAEVFKLEQNYRSTQNIVNVANSIISCNEGQIRKNVFSENAEGERLRVVKAYTDREEAELVADMVRQAGREAGGKWREVAILYRNNSQSRAMEEALRKRGVPYRIYSGRSFYDRKEIRDMVAYFRLIVNPRDDEALRRVINTPARGIGATTVGRLTEIAARRGVSIWEVLEAPGDDAAELKSAGVKLAAFTELIRSFSLERTRMSLYEFGLDVATRSGILGSYKMAPSPESDGALDNIGELLTSMQQFKEQRVVLGYEPDDEAADAEPTIEEWLQNVSLMSDTDKVEAEADNHVVLMTVHSAKGLEFDTVFIVGVEENLFPSQMSAGSTEKLEEERRLFYVAVTRARQRVTVSFARQRFKWGSTEPCRPSRFIAEMDERFVELPADMEDEAMDGDPLDDIRRKLEHRQSARTEWAGGAQYYKKRDVASQAPHSQRPIGFPGPDSTRSRPRAVEPVKPDLTKFHKVATSSGPTVSALPGEASKAWLSASGPMPGHSAGDFASDSPTPGSAPSGSVHSVGGFDVGMMVAHAKFGVGRIEALEDLTSDIKITATFPEPFGRKSLLNRYANLKIVK